METKCKSTPKFRKSCLQHAQVIQVDPHELKFMINYVPTIVSSSVVWVSCSVNHNGLQLSGDSAWPC